MPNIQMWLRYPSGLMHFKSRDLKEVFIDTFLGKPVDWFVKKIAELNMWGIEQIEPVDPNVYKLVKEDVESLVVFSSPTLDDDVRKAHIQFPKLEISVFVAVTGNSLIIVGENTYPVLSFLYLSEEEYTEISQEIAVT